MKVQYLNPEFLYGVIHMNGRIYDPQLGRMLQADPFIQAPRNTQSYNRYSYVLNNPLGYTDPSGYNFVKQFAGVIVGGVLVVATGGMSSPFVASWYGAAGLGAITGGVGAAVNGGNVLQGVAIGAFTGAATYGVATGLEAQGISALSVEGVMSFGAVGGISSELSGGNFGHGFVIAGIGGPALGVGGSNWDIAVRTIGKAIIGGTLSELTGGKFANGAASAAFVSIVAEGAVAASRTNSFDPISPDVATRDVETAQIALNVDAELIESPYAVKGPGNLPAYSRSGIMEEVVVTAQNLNGCANGGCVVTPMFQMRYQTAQGFIAQQYAALNAQQANVFRPIGLAFGGRALYGGSKFLYEAWQQSPIALRQKLFEAFTETANNFAYPGGRPSGTGLPEFDPNQYPPPPGIHTPR